MRLILIALLGLCFVFNAPVIGYFYNPDFEFEKFYATRNLVYEIMFALFFILVFSLSKSLTKSVALFFSILAFGSAIDKMLGITWYLPSDLVLVILSFTVSFYPYVREFRNGN